MPAAPSRIKVAHVATVDLSLHHLLLDQMLSQKAAGYEVVAVSAPGRHVAALEAAGIPHLAVPLTRRLTPLADLRALFALEHLYRRESFTLVHTHTPKASLLGQLAARMAGVPVVVDTLHGILLDERRGLLARQAILAALKLAARCSHHILSQSRADVEILLAEGVCPAEKIEVLGNGIDLEAFSRPQLDPAERAALHLELGFPAGAEVVGFVGRLSVAKGFDHFMAAFSRALRRRPALHALIVGEPDTGASDPLGPSLAERLGVAERCRFLGWRSGEEIPRLLSALDVLLLPSVREGFPRVVMEASALGVPVVASDIRGVREALVPGINGLLVPYGDAEGLAEATAGLLAHPERARALGEGGRALARREFDQKRVFARVEAAYRRLLLARGLRPPAAPEPAS